MGSFFRNLFSKGGAAKVSPHIRNVDLDFLKGLERAYPEMTPAEKKRMITVLVDMMKHPNVVPQDLEAIAAKAEGKIGTLTKKAVSGSKKIARYENIVAILKKAIETYEKGIDEQKDKVQESKDLAAEYGI